MWKCDKRAFKYLLQIIRLRGHESGSAWFHTCLELIKDFAPKQPDETKNVLHSREAIIIGTVNNRGSLPEACALEKANKFGAKIRLFATTSLPAQLWA